MRSPRAARIRVSGPRVGGADRDPSEFVAPFDAPDGGVVKMSHYPYIGDSHGADRHADMRPDARGNRPLIHGHVHTEWQTRDNMFNVGVDVNDFKPVPEDELVAWMETL